MLICWIYPSAGNSHHQDYRIFSRECQDTFICHCYWVGGRSNSYVFSKSWNMVNQTEPLQPPQKTKKLSAQGPDHQLDSTICNHIDFVFVVNLQDFWLRHFGRQKKSSKRHETQLANEEFHVGLRCGSKVDVRCNVG